jgi:uncharacterized protein (TIGR03437 family)
MESKSLMMRCNFFFFRWIGLALVSALLPAQIPVQFNANPARVVGQLRVQQNLIAPNLIEGREFNSPFGIAVDTSASPPVLYVSDTGNNRVMIWRNAAAANGSSASAVIGQNDFLTNLPGGPGTASSVGLRAPSGLAVDARGNLYVLDTGNNRILRYPRPYERIGGLIQPDMVIGQTSFNANRPNEGEFAPSARSLSFSSGDTFTGGLAFDRSGNLWVTDARNNRILRYPASALGDSPANGPAADTVLGQTSFTTLAATNWNDPLNRLSKSVMLQPSSITFDPAGRLYVGDNAGRVLVYAPPFATGMAAARLLGIAVNVQGQPPRPPINEIVIARADGIFANASGVFVADTLLNRILRYDPFETWPEETPANPSPAARGVFGQVDFNAGRANRGAREPSETAIFSPSAMAGAGSDIFLCDTSNHRVITLPATSTVTGLGPATRVLGQTAFNFRGVNLVEGKELWLAAASVSVPNATPVVPGAGIVVDKNSSPPRLYIADTYNNRVLGFSNAFKVRPGDSADLVIGQPSLSSTAVNFPNNDSEQPSDSGLNAPIGVALDDRGDLYVADAGNGRVLRFPRPFEQPQRAGQRANLVVGQSGFNIKITDATRQNMSRPYGLAFTVEGHMLVSDSVHNRVLLFRKGASGDFSNGMQAATVLGQRDFTSISPGTAENNFNFPMHIATDTDDRLYVCDAGNRRVAIFDRVLSANNFASPAVVLSTISQTGERLREVQGINVSPRTGEIWVTDTPANRVLRFPKFDSLLTGTAFPNFSVPSLNPLAVSIDAFDNLLIADSGNRVAMHYPGLVSISAAHYLNRRISPGMVSALYPLGIRFGEETKTFNEVPNPIPLPRELADLEVLINEAPVPLYFVSPGQINYYAPMNLQPGEQAEFLVQKKSTGQILASGLLDIATATPGFFTTTQNGQGQIAALNEDNTVNSTTNAIERGKVIQLFATGQGFIPNAPPDGTPPSGVVPTPFLPRVVMGSGFVADSDILYSGLAPGLVGVWQINVRVPMSVPPSSNIEVVVTANSIPSNQSAETPPRRIVTTIATR